MKSNITLVGMPASGKSTIGVLLAKRLGYSFVDVDIVIQEKTGQLKRDHCGARNRRVLKGRGNSECRAGDRAFRDRSGRQRDLRPEGHGTPA